MRPKGKVVVDEVRIAQLMAETTGVIAAYLFGSVVRGETDHFSDVNVAVLLDDKLTKEQRWDIVARLMDKLFSLVGQDKADVVDLKEAPTWFQRVIVKTGRVIYDRDPEKQKAYEASLSQSQGDSDEGRWQGLGAVRLRLEALERNIARLEELARLSYDEFMADPRNSGAAERWLQTSIEALADIPRHLIRRLRLPMPVEYCQILHVLAKAGYLPTEDVPTYEAMMRFHNRLVHHYPEVLPDEIYCIITQELDDLRRWCDQLVSSVAGTRLTLANQVSSFSLGTEGGESEWQKPSLKRRLQRPSAALKRLSPATPS